jgi:hypothetical protein
MVEGAHVQARCSCSDYGDVGVQPADEDGPWRGRIQAGARQCSGKPARTASDRRSRSVHSHSIGCAAISSADSRPNRMSRVHVSRWRVRVLRTGMLLGTRRHRKVSQRTSAHRIRPEDSLFLGRLGTRGDTGNSPLLGARRSRRSRKRPSGGDDGLLPSSPPSSLPPILCAPHPPDAAVPEPA